MEPDWQAIGGHVALDLCNTVAWRRDPEREAERLTSPARLAAWFGSVAAPALAGPPARGGGVRVHGSVTVGAADDARALARIRTLREATARVVRAQVAAELPPSRDVGVLLEAGRAAARRAQASPALPLTWSVEVRTLADVVTALALAVDDLLRADAALARLRECQGDGCGWFFVDTSRNHSRRWCDPEDCGNRARVRAYVARRRDAGQPAER